jgi:hypothetical protein
MKTLSVFVVHATSIVAAFSQLTITSADFQKNLGAPIKTTNYTSSDTSGLRSVINASGANMTWNLAGRTFSASDTSTVTLLNKSTSGAPQQTNSAFSSATLVNQQRTASKPLFTFWTYYSATTTALSYYGYVQDSAGVVLSNQTNSPSQRLQNFPTSYLTTWSWSSTVTVTNFGTSNVGVQFSEAGADLVDAYGTVTTPEGTFPCLRIRRKFSILLGFFSIVTYGYEFVDQNRLYARIDADEVSSVPVPRSVGYYRQTTTTGVADVSSSPPPDFQLFPNYPNPFNPSTVIEFSLPHEELVTLKVYSELGQEVGVLVDERKQAGKHLVTFNGHGLPSGVYIYRLNAGNHTESKKLLFVK